nr:hypothetical protein [Tanacetum cinerariifolium]
MHGDETPDAYLNCAQDYANALVTISEPVKDKDLVMLVFSGLYKEYNGLKTIITAHQSPTAFSKLHALLSDHDYMLGKTHAPVKSITSSFAANYAVGSPSMPKAHQALFLELTAQLNTRANSHVTPDLEAIDNSEAYYGDDALHLGNGNNKGTIDNIIFQLGSIFALKDLGPLNYFLGIEIVPHVSGILLSQKKYILELLQSAVKYQQVVGSLQYVTLSRPDIAFAINKVILILLLKLSQMLTGLEIQMIDGLWGFAIYLGSNLISWTAHKQRTILRSSTKAEYKALADTIAEITWLQALFNKLGIRSFSTPILGCDNHAATYLSDNPIFQARTKYIEIDYHFVREKVAQGDLQVQYISTHDQIADIFTKPLPTPIFLFLRSKLQRKYVVENFEMAHMVTCNPCRTPIDMKSKLGVDVDPVCLHVHDPQEPYFSTLKQILRLLSWSSKWQSTLSRSIAEAKYPGVANVVAETCWLRNLLRELHTPLSSSTLVYCDNVSVVYLSYNPAQHQRTKHIKIDIYFVRDLVAVD